MTEVQLVNPEALPPAVGYSHAAVAHDWIWLGGQISSDAAGNLLHEGNIVDQFRQALRNVLIALRAAGGEPEGIVKLTYYVTDLASYRANLEPVGRAYRDVLGRRYPASSLFEVRGLFEPNALIEIECVAIRRLSSP